MTEQPKFNKILRVAKWKNGHKLCTLIAIKLNSAPKVRSNWIEGWCEQDPLMILQTVKDVSSLMIYNCLINSRGLFRILILRVLNVRFFHPPDSNKMYIGFSTWWSENIWFTFIAKYFLDSNWGNQPLWYVRSFM